jgi:SOS-response transcriptional repressor LexA
MARDEVLKEFGDFLVSIRCEKGKSKRSLKQVELLAQKKGISLPGSTLSQYEKGVIGSIDGDRLRVLATVYNRPYEEIVNRYVAARFGIDLLNPTLREELLYPDAEHAELHRKLQEVLKLGNEQWNITAKTNIELLHSGLAGYQDKPLGRRGESSREPLAIYEAPSPNMRTQVPYYESIAAGNPIDVARHGQMWIDIDKKKTKPGWYALRVEGNSMEPDYRTGDVILMDSYKEPRDGSIVAAWIRNIGGTLKTYSRYADEITLTPINKDDHSPLTCHASEITVQGVLVEKIRGAGG